MGCTRGPRGSSNRRASVDLSSPSRSTILSTNCNWRNWLRSRYKLYAATTGLARNVTSQVRLDLVGIQIYDHAIDIIRVEVRIRVFGTIWSVQVGRRWPRGMGVKGRERFKGYATNIGLCCNVEVASRVVVIVFCIPVVLPGMGSALECKPNEAT